MAGNIGPFNQQIVGRGAELMHSLIKSAMPSEDNNPAPNVTDNIPVLFKQYMDWARDHPQVVNQRVLQLIFTMNDDIFSLFVPKVEKKAVHQWSVVDMPPFVMDEMSRKAPARNIHRKSEHFVEHSVWTGIGYLLDKNYLDTPEGPNTAYQMNLYINSLTIAYFQMSCYRAFFNAVSYYQRPEQRVIGDNLPLDIYAAIRYSNQEHGIFAKSAGFIKNSLVRYDQVFQQTSNTVGNLIVSADFIDCIFGKSSQLIEGSSAGPAEAKDNRENSDKVRRIGNVGFITSPLTSRQVHDNKSEFVMFTETAKGSFWRFPLCYLEQTLPDEFNSELMGTVKTYSYETDRLDSHRFIDFLRHCPEFVPATGAINYPLLKRFLERGSPIDYAGSYRVAGAPATRYKRSNALNMFDKCKVEWSQDNFKTMCNRMHMFINHLDDANLHEATPVCCIGEIDEYHMPTDSLMYYGQNFAARLFECLTSAEVIEFKACISDITRNNSGDVQPWIDELVAAAAGFAVANINEYGVPTAMINSVEAFEDAEINLKNAKRRLASAQVAGVGAAPATVTRAQDVLNALAVPYGRATIPIMYSLWALDDNEYRPFQHLSFRYITLLKKLLAHFETLTDNHVACDINNFPSHIAVDDVNAVDPIIFKKLVTFHHLLVQPGNRFYVLRNVAGVVRILPVVTRVTDAFVPTANTADAEKYDGMLAYLYPAGGPYPAASTVTSGILGRSGNVRAAYLNLIAVNGLATKSKIDKLIDERKRYYDDELDIARKIHPVALQHMLFNLDKNPSFAARLKRSFQLETMESIGFRALLFDMVNLREFEKQHTVNRAMPFSGLVLRGDELQRTMSIPVVANGSVGNFFYDPNYKFISFDQGTQTYNIMTYAQYAPIITDNKKFFVAENAWGGEAMGGKGSHYFNEDTDVTPDNEQMWSDLVSRIGHGDKLGYFSNVPVLQSLRAGIERTYQTALDRRGYFHEDDFIGLYEYDDGFRPRTDLMYDNCLFANFVYRFPTIVFPRNAMNAYSFQDKANKYRVNNICGETTTVVYDHFSRTKTRKIKSAHAWGDQEAGSFRRETGIVGPDYLNDDAKTRHEDSILRKRKLNEIMDTDHQVVFE